MGIVSDARGHSDTRITRDIYQRVLPHVGKNAAEAPAKLVPRQRRTKPLRSRIAHASRLAAPGRVTRHALNREKPQVTASESQGFPEPPSGFEPETYALRVRCSGHLS